MKQTSRRLCSVWTVLIVVCLLGAVRTGSANRMLIRTKNGLLEYDASRIRSMTFSGPEDAPAQPKAKTVNWSTRVLVRQQAATLYFDVRLRPDTDYSLRLYTMAGALVASRDGKAQGARVRFAPPVTLGRGVYLFRLETPSETIVRTAIKR